MDYRRHQNRRTTADIFFRSSNRKSIKDCEAWVNADGTLLSVFFDDDFHKPEALYGKGVACVDFYVKTSLYLEPDKEQAADEKR